MDNRRRAYDIDNLNILIVSTSKTGNTWIKRLLVSIYDLLVVPVGMVFDALDIAGLGPRWDGHQHYAALADLPSCRTDRLVA